MQQNKNLETLVLRGNDISGSQLADICSSLLSNRQIPLKSLDLSRNQLCDRAAVLLSNCLKEVTSLESLHLMGNLIENEGGEALLLLIRENKSITKVTLEANLLRQDLLQQIEVACKQNKPYKQIRDIPNIKKEIKCLKKVKGDFSELENINLQLQSNKTELSKHLE